MSYILRGFGTAAYTHPIANSGFGGYLLELPGGIVLGYIEPYFILASAGPYPLLGQIVCGMANGAVRVYGLLGWLVRLVTGDADTMGDRE